MPSNVTADPGAAGAVFVTRQLTHDGDTSQLPGNFIMGIAGTEDSYTATAIPGDATNGLDVDVTRVSGTFSLMICTLVCLRRRRWSSLHWQVCSLPTADDAADRRISLAAARALKAAVVATTIRIQAHRSPRRWCKWDSTASANTRTG